MNGYAPLGQLLTASECAELRQMYSDPKRFRSRIDMQRYRFGRGEYQYFAYPLPEPLPALRQRLYEELARTANEWAAALRLDRVYPQSLDEFLTDCHAAGQRRPTPLLLRYGPGDYNCLHQDLYGSVYFPFQVIVGLSAPGTDYTGGELLLVEQRPRAQSIGRAISLAQGHGVAITTCHRPVAGSRGYYRANLKHGVSEVLSGQRFTLGLIFHDAV